MTWPWSGRFYSVAIFIVHSFIVWYYLCRIPRCILTTRSAAIHLIISISRMPFLDTIPGSVIVCPPSLSLSSLFVFCLKSSSPILPVRDPLQLPILPRQKIGWLSSVHILSLTSARFRKYCFSSSGSHRMIQFCVVILTMYACTSAHPRCLPIPILVCLDPSLYTN